AAGPVRGRVDEQRSAGDLPGAGADGAALDAGRSPQRPGTRGRAARGGGEVKHMGQAALAYRDLPTTSIKGLEIFSVGTWNGDKYTHQDLEAMVDAFGEVGFEPPVKAGHENGQEATGTMKRLFGAPALGYVERLYVGGRKLFADIRDIPKRFADLIQKGTY